MYNAQNPTYASIVTKNKQHSDLQQHLQVKKNEEFLVQTPQPHQLHLGHSNQVNQVKEPFLGQSYNIQQPSLGHQTNQNQIMDLLVSLNQRIKDLEKCKSHM